MAGQTQRSALTSDSSLATDEIVELALAVARLGEHDRRGWWQSRALGPAGRVVLKSRLPRTWRAAGLEIDMESARRRHDEVIDRPNAVHLFSALWPVGRWVRAWLAETKMSAEEPALLQQLEQMSTEGLLTLLAERCGPSENGVRKGRALLVGNLKRSELMAPETALVHVRTLAGAYVSLSEFIVPYVEVTS